MSSPVMVPMLSPDGRSGDIPADRVNEALAAGFKGAVIMTSPDGKQGYVPHDRAQEAVKAGFKVGTPSAIAFEQRGQNAQGFGSALGSDLAGMAKGAGPMLLGAPGMAYQGAKQSLADYQSYKMTGKTLAERDAEARAAAGHGTPYQVGAGVNEALGVNVKGMEQAANQGDVGGVLGHAAAVPAATAITAGIAKGVPAAADALRPAASSMAERLYRSAIKPSTAMPVEKAQRIISTGLDNGIPVSEAGAEKLAYLQDDLNKKIADSVASDPSVFINRSKVAQRLKGTYQNFSQQVNPTPDLKSIDTIGSDFTKSNPQSIPAVRAQAMKQGTYQQIKSANYGTMTNAQVEAQKALARGLKEELEVQFPELKGLNSQEGKLLELEPVLERALGRIGNHEMIGIGSPIVAGTGKLLAGTPGAVAAALIKRVIDAPVVKTKLAIALNSAGKGRMGLPGAHARIAAYSAALGSGASRANDEPTGDQGR
jgi:hypothetical protein